MGKLKLKKEVIFGIYVVMFLLLISVLYYADLSNKALKTDEDYNYVSKLFDDNTKSVVSTPTLLMRPYNNADVKVLKSFYDYKAEEKSQENSIINYDTTYMQNSGVIYSGPAEPFEVISVLDGKVTSVKDDKILGKTVTIQHDNNIITTYQSLSEVTVKENDQVSQGTVIGKSGQSNLVKDSSNNLLFQMTINGQTVNPENYYDKQVNDIKIN